MNNKLCIAALFTALIFIQLGCNKNKDHDPEDVSEFDTIFPKSYLPVYPGSYWVYGNEDGRIDSVFSADDYVLDYYQNPEAGYVSDTFYVPELDNVPIWGYEAHTGSVSHSGSYPFTLILSDTAEVGYDWIIAYWQGNENRRQIIAKDTTIQLASGAAFDSVIIVKEYQTLPINVLEWWYKRYYAKGVGLIKEESWFSNDSTCNNKELIGFKINR